MGARSGAGKDFKWSLDASLVTQSRASPVYAWNNHNNQLQEPNVGFPGEPCVMDNACAYDSDPKQFCDYMCNTVRTRIVCQFEK